MTSTSKGGVALQPDAGTFAALLRAAVDRDPIDRRTALSGCLRRMRERNIAPLEEMYAVLLGHGRRGVEVDGDGDAVTLAGEGARASSGKDRTGGSGRGQGTGADLADALAVLVERDTLGVWRRTRVAESLCQAFVAAGRFEDAEAVMQSLAEEADVSWKRWEGRARAAVQHARLSAASPEAELALLQPRAAELRADATVWARRTSAVARSLGQLTVQRAKVGDVEGAARLRARIVTCDSVRRLLSVVQSPFPILLG